MTETPARSLADLLQRRVRATPDRVAFLAPADPGWREMTWAAVGVEVRALACGLRALGLAPEQRGAILSATRLEWILGDLGDPLRRRRHHDHLSVEHRRRVRLHPARRRVPRGLRRERGAARQAARSSRRAPRSRSRRPDRRRAVDDGWVMPLAELVALGRAWDAAHPGEIERGLEAVGPGSLATLIYTSGTTGKPKGVELPHDCWLYEAEAIDELGLLRADDVQYLWLPLSHSSARCSRRRRCRSASPPRSTAASTRSSRTSPSCSPTFVAAVPRIFEKVHNKVVDRRAEAGGLKLQIFRWAIGVGREVSRSSRRSAVRRAGSPSTTASPTSWCSPRSAPASAAASASSSRAARRSRARSPSSSTPRAS